MPPKQQLSKGTLGLKFMNRTLPSPDSGKPATTAAAAPATRNAPAQAAGAAPSAVKPTATGAPTSQTSAALGAASAGKSASEDDWTRRTTGGARAVIHESSLLSFPLLSTLSTRAHASTSTTFTSTSATYSSMPLTAGAISGRRSYGGANVEIEKLNDPSSHQAPESSTSAESKSALKKRLKAERDAAPVSVRRSGAGGSTLSSVKTGKRTAALDEERRGGARDADGSKRRRTGEFDEPDMGEFKWEGGEDQVSLGSGSGAGAGAGAKGGFARPAGFEGARSKGKGRARADDKDGDRHRWAQQGETREWDEDKVGNSDDSLGEGEDEDEDEDATSDDEVEEELAVHGTGRRQGKGMQTGKVERAEVEWAIRRSEEKRMAVGGSKAGGAGKKRR